MKGDRSTQCVAEGHTLKEERDIQKDKTRQKDIVGEGAQIR